MSDFKPEYSLIFPIKRNFYNYSHFDLLQNFTIMFGVYFFPICELHFFIYGQNPIIEVMGHFFFTHFCNRGTYKTLQHVMVNRQPVRFSFRKKLLHTVCTLSVLRIFVHSAYCHFSCEKSCNSNFSVKLQHSLPDFCYLTIFFLTWS